MEYEQNHKAPQPPQPPKQVPPAQAQYSAPVAQQQFAVQAQQQSAQQHQQMQKQMQQMQTQMQQTRMFNPRPRYTLLGIYPCLSIKLILSGRITTSRIPYQLCHYTRTLHKSHRHQANTHPSVPDPLSPTHSTVTPVRPLPTLTSFFA